MVSVPDRSGKTDFEVTDMILADKIIDLRKKNGWSQEELAEKLQVTRQRRLYVPHHLPDSGGTVRLHRDGR